MDEKEIKEIKALQGIYKSVEPEAILEGEKAIVIHAERLAQRNAEEKEENEEPIL